MYNNKSIDLSFAESKSCEKFTFLAITQNVLSKLGKVVLDKHSYGANHQDKPYNHDNNSSSVEHRTAKNTDFEWLEIGTSATWHGYPDEHIHAGGINDIAVVASSNEDQEDTPGNSVAIEAKLGSY